MKETSIWGKALKDSKTFIGQSRLVKMKVF